MLNRLASHPDLILDAAANWAARHPRMTCVLLCCCIVAVFALDAPR